MPPPYDYDDGWDSSYSHQSTSVSSDSSCIPLNIVLKADETNQKIYNQTREKQSRLHISSYTNNELLNPPSLTPFITRNIISNSYASSNCSRSESDNLYTSPA